MGRATAPSRFDDIPRGVVEARCCSTTIAGVRASFFPSLSECDWGRADDKDENARRQLVDFGECLVDKKVLNSPFKEERTFRVYKTRRRKLDERDIARVRA